MEIEKLYENFNIFHWNLFLDTNVFKNYNLNKEYDILMYGCAKEGSYKLRFKIKNILEKLKKEGYKIKI